MNEQSNYTNPLEEQEHIEVIDFLSELKWQDVNIDDHWLDLTEDYVRPQFTLSYKGVPFAPLGGIQALTGQAGHGKTAFFTMLMVAIMKGEYCGLKYELSRDIPQPKVLYIDTEMEKGNTQLVVKRLYKMMGWDKMTQQDQFRVLRLREEDKASNRWKMTLKAIFEFRPNVVFLDGFIDVLNDFNDNKECAEVIYQDMKTASFYNISFWNLLHQNPGSTKMVGHGGSFLERKTTDVFMVQKDKEGTVVSFSAKQLKARGRDVSEMTYMFGDDEDHLGIPFIDDKTPSGTANNATKTEPDAEEVKNMVSVIGIRQNISLTTLREDMKTAFHIGSGKAKEYIDLAVHMGFLIVSDNKFSPNPADLFDDDKYKLPF